jgi:hypothetical protein
MAFLPRQRYHDYRVLCPFFAEARDCDWRRSRLVSSRDYSTKEQNVAKEKTRVRRLLLAASFSIRSQSFDSTRTPILWTNLGTDLEPVINLEFCGMHAGVDKVGASAPIVCPTNSCRREGVDAKRPGAINRRTRHRSTEWAVASKTSAQCINRR